MEGGFFKSSVKCFTKQGVSVFIPTHDIILIVTFGWTIPGISCYHIQRNDTLNCVSAAYIRKDCTVRQHRVVKVCVENAAWILSCVSISLVFWVFFLSLDCVFMCVHLLFSNRGDNSISNFLDLFSAVEKKGNQPIVWKRKKKTKKKSSVFSCQGTISSLTMEAWLIDHRKISLTLQLWEKPQWKNVFIVLMIYKQGVHRHRARLRDTDSSDAPLCIQQLNVFSVVVLWDLQELQVLSARASLCKAIHKSFLAQQVKRNAWDKWTEFLPG